MITSTSTAIPPPAAIISVANQVSSLITDSIGNASKVKLPVDLTPTTMSLISTPDLRAKVINEILAPQYLTSIQSAFASKTHWERTNNVFMILGKVSLGISGVLAFISVYFKDTMWSLLAGSMSTVGAVLAGFEIGASKQAKAQEIEISKILSRIGLEVKSPESITESSTTVNMA